MRRGIAAGRAGRKGQCRKKGKRPVAASSRRAASTAAADPRGSEPVSRAGAPRRLAELAHPRSDPQFVFRDRLARVRAARALARATRRRRCATRRGRDAAQASPARVRELIDFLATNQLLSPARLSRRGAGAGCANRSSPGTSICCITTSFSAFRCSDPDAFLARTVGVDRRVVHPGVRRVRARSCSGSTCTWSRASGTALPKRLPRMLTPQGILVYAVAVDASQRSSTNSATPTPPGATACACRRWASRSWCCGRTSTPIPSETWKLVDRRKQIVIAAAGMASELALAVFATLLWAIVPEGGVKNVLFVLATSTWVMTLAINASPFMRFDGYFVLSDSARFPQPARAQLGLRALLAAHHVLRPGRAAARARPSPARSAAG